MSNSLLIQSSLANIQVVTEEYPPFNYMENGSVAGNSTVVVKKVFELAGLKPDIQLMPWARAYNIAQSTPGTVIYSIVKTEAREKLFKFIGPINKMESAFFSTKTLANTIKLSSLNDAKQYLTGTVAEDFDEQNLIAGGFKIGENLASHPNIDQAFLSMARGRTQLFLGNNATMAYLCKKLNVNESDIVKIYELSESEKKPQEMYMALSINTPEDVINKITAAFEAYKATTQN